MAGMARSPLTIVLAFLLCGLFLKAYGSRSLLATNHPLSWAPGTPYPPLNIAAGDTVSFRWQGQHDVYRIPSDSCPSTFENGSNGQQELAPVSSGGTYTTPPLAAGTYYYACSVADHCKEGQKIAVNVGAGAAG